jgi:mannose-6-phosphate isomerase-like protein (cupin superfamily)
MPVVLHALVPSELFQAGATYQTLVGDSQGSTPIRIGIQTSPPGYTTPLHSHPYLEVLTVLEGKGDAWMAGSDDLIQLRPGITLIIPAGVRHRFTARGSEPLKTYGVHASPHRIVQVHESDLAQGDNSAPGRSSPL